MPSNSTNLRNNIFYRAIKFANDCGTQALGDKDFDKIREIYMKFSVDTELLFNKELDSKLSNLKEEVGKLEQKPSTFKPFSDDPLLQPEYANERIWGWNHAIKEVIDLIDKAKEKA